MVKDELGIAMSLHVFQAFVQKSVVELVGGDDATRLSLQRTGKLFDFEYRSKA